MKIAVNGFDMNFKIEGPADAPWLTFANSLVTSLEMWDQQARALSDRYRVLRFDMRGHGGSDAPRPPYSIAELARDVFGLWGALGVDRSHFVGLSLGGMVGIHFAARHPARLRSLVAADCRAEANSVYQGLFADRIRATREHGMEAVVEQTLQRFFTPAFASRHPDVIAAFRRMILATSPDGHIGCCEAIRGLSENASLPNLKVPTLYIGGEHDIGAPPEIMRAMHEATPGSRHVTIEGAGHISNVERPDRFMQEIEPFLAAH